MAKETFQAYCIRTNVTAINKTVNTNSNTYPFITVLRGSIAENIYFGRKSAAKVALGTVVKSIAKELFISEAVNSAGETRMKLSFNGDATYADLDDMFA